jgi:hypothetical protein
MTSPRKPTAGFWITVALVAVLVGYPLSFGPACWMSSRLKADTLNLSAIYRPITSGLNINYSGKLDSAIRWYAKVGAVDQFWGWWDFIDDDGTQQWTWAPLYL